MRGSTRPARGGRRREALRETVRRRRAAGGPAEHIFASLVGLELRPRKLREAAAVWAALTAARGVEGRDALWAHPDLAPSAEAFADPQAFARVGRGDDTAMDAALAALLDEPAAPPATDDSGASGEGAGGEEQPDDDAPGRPGPRPEDDR